MAEYKNIIKNEVVITGEAEISRLERELTATKSQLDRVNLTLQATESELSRVQTQFDNFAKGNGVDILRDRLEQFKDTASRSVDEFRTFLNSVHLNDDWGNNDYQFEELFNEIKEGSITASEAITRVKTEFRALMEENYNSSGGLFDSQMVQQFASSLQSLGSTVEVVLHKIESIESNGVKSLGGGSGSSDVTDVIERIEAAAHSMTSEVKDSYESITNLVKAINEYANLDDTKILGVSQAFKNIADIGKGSYGSKSIENIVYLAKQLQAIGGEGSIRFDLTGLNDIKVSKASMSNLATYLPQIAATNVEKLEKLSHVDLTNFNDIKVRKSSIESIADLANAIKVLKEAETARSKANSGGNGVAKSTAKEESDSAKNEYGDATRAIREYYATLATLSKTKGHDVVLSDSGWASASGNYNELAEALNRTKTAYDLVTRSAENLPVERQAKLYELITVEANKYGLALEKQANKERIAADAAAKKADKIAESASAKKARAAESAQYKDATKAVNEYYSALSTLLATKNNDIELAESGWISTTGNYSELANTLNRTKMAYDLVSESIKNMPSDDQVKIQALMIQQANAYSLALERQANKERDAAKAAEENDHARKVRQQTADMKAARIAVDSYHDAIIQGESALRGWSAAEKSRNLESRQAYEALRESVSRMRDAHAQYDGTKEKVTQLSRAVADYRSTLKSTEQVLRENGDAHKTFGQRLGRLAQKFGSWLTVSQVIMHSVRTVRSMVKMSIELDDAMTQLRIVTNATEEEYSKFGDTVSETAERIGASVTDLIGSTTTYARLGYSLEESSQLAEFTSMLQNVGDIDASGAQDAITSIVKAFNIDVGQIESVMDKLVAVGNNYPISVSQIAEGMTNASSALSAAGNTFEESVALLTAANTTIQNAAKSSTGLRTIAARIRNTKAELDDLGETMTEAAHEDLVKLLTDYNVALTDSNNEYRSTYDIMSDIASQWDHMTSMEQAALADAMSGTRQQAVFFSIIDQFKEASGSMETMANSENTLQNSYDEFMESTTAHINAFKAAFTSLSSEIVDSDLMKTFVDSGTAILNITERIVKALGALPALLTVISPFLGKLSVFRTVSGEDGSMQIRTFRGAARDELAEDLRLLDEYNYKITGMGATADDLAQKQIIWNDTIGKGTIRLRDSVRVSDEATVSSEAYRGAIENSGAAVSQMGTKAHAATVGVRLLNVALNMLVGLGIGLAINGVISAITSISEKSKKAAESAKRNAEAMKAESDASLKTRESLRSLIDEYARLGRESDGAWSSEEANRLSQIQDQITELVGKQADNLDLVNGKIDEEYEKLVGVYNLISSEDYDRAEAYYLEEQEKLSRGYTREKNWYGESVENDQMASWYITRAYQELNDATQEAAQKWWGEQVGLSDTKWLGDVPKALDEISSYEDGLQRLYEWRRMILDAESEGFGSGDGEDWEPYDTGAALSYLTDKITEFENVISNAQEAKDRFFSVKADKEALGYLAENEIETQQEFDDYVLSVYSNKDISGDYAEALINTMHSYLPAFEIPEDIKRAFIADRDELIKEVTEEIPDSDSSVIGEWLDKLSNDQLQAFVGWWDKNKSSNVVTSSAKSMMSAFEMFLAQSNDMLKSAAGDAEEKMGRVSESVKGAITGINDVLKFGQDAISFEDFNSGALKDYRSAIEYVNGSMRINAERAYEIAKAKAEEKQATIAANKAVEQSKYLENSRQISKLREQLQSGGQDVAGATDSINRQIDSLLKQNEAIASVCDGYSILSNEIERAIGAYQNWLNAQSASDYGDIANDATSAMQLIADTYNSEKDEYGNFGSKKFDAAVDWIIPDDVDSEDVKSIESYMSNLKSYLIFGEDKNDKGEIKGLNIEKFLEESVEAGLMYLDDSGTYQIAGQTAMEDFADGLHLSSGLVQAFFDELQLKGAEFSWADEANKTLGDLAVSATEAAEKIRSSRKDLGQDISIRLDISDLETKEEKISTLNDTIDQMNGIKAEVDLDSSDIEYANEVIRYCVAQKQLLTQPDVMTVDTSIVQGELGNAIKLLQEFQTASNNLELAKALGIDTTRAQEELENATRKVQDLDANIVSEKALNIDTSSVDTIAESLNGLTAEMLVHAGVDDTAIIGYQEAEHSADGTVKWDNDTELVDLFAAGKHYAEGTVEWYNDVRLVKTQFYAKGRIQWNDGYGGVHNLNGSANAGGNWSVKRGGSTLVGELGREIVVDPSTGRWYTVGDNGAEFRDIPTGAIVFNHKQTEALLENGYVSGRAQALINGSAMVTGGYKPQVPNGDTWMNEGHHSSEGSSSTNSSSDDSRGNSKDDSDSIIDWIEIAIDRIERAINRLSTVASSSFKSLVNKLSANDSKISTLYREKEIKSAGYDRYMQEANSLGLSSDLASKIQNGTIDITEYDEETANLIKKYQGWYEKALDCSDAMQELSESIASVYESKFNDIASDYENQLSLLEHLTTTYDNGLDMLEEKGYLASTKYYASLQDVEREKAISQKRELADLTKAMSDAMKSGEIEEGSEAWYKFQQKINEVKEGLKETELNLVKFGNAMRDIEWDRFDYLQDRISSITEESDFLIDLLDNSDLYTNEGQLTEAGTAAMGLHGQNLNVYMAQADKYADEILSLNEAIAKDPNNTVLINRREELLQAQRDSILAAEDEKQAIVDMVEDGIKLELDALKDLISSYTDALDKAKSMYEYQKKVQDQTSEIARLQKQLTAYRGDDSEENRAIIQRIEVSLKNAKEDLEETQYEHYISEQKQLLDELYAEYETILNQRLDNIDALISDMTEYINANSAVISDKIGSECENIGYTLTESMKAIWSDEGGAGSIITKYGDAFGSQLTSVNNVLSAISANVAEMVRDSDEEAQETITGSSSTTQESEPSITPVPDTNEQIHDEELSSGALTDKDYYGVALAIWNGNYGWGVGSTRRDRLKSKGFDPDKMQSIVGELGRDGYVPDGSWEGKYYGITSLAPYHFNKYLHGGLVDYTGIAQVDGTPNNPEIVLDAKDSENFISLRDAMRKLESNGGAMNALFGNSVSADIIEKLASIQDPRGNQETTIKDIHYEINIPIDHVEDYDDFVNKMVSDGRFEQLVQSMTIDRLNGGSRLSKNRFRR